MYYVYILRSKKNNQQYTGFTNDLQRRLDEHNNGESGYTSTRRPYELMYYEASRNVKDAIAREKYLKSGMGKRYLKNRMKYDILQTADEKGL